MLYCKGQKERTALTWGQEVVQQLTSPALHSRYTNPSHETGSNKQERCALGPFPRTRSAPQYALLVQPWPLASRRSASSSEKPTPLVSCSTQACHFGSCSDESICFASAAVAAGSTSTARHDTLCRQLCRNTTAGLCLVRSSKRLKVGTMSMA